MSNTAFKTQYTPINIHVRDTEYVNKILDNSLTGSIAPLNGQDLIFSTDGSDIVFNNRVYTRLEVLDLESGRNAQGTFYYNAPTQLRPLNILSSTGQTEPGAGLQNAGNLKGKVVVGYNLGTAGQKQVWVRSMSESDVPEHLPNTTAGKADSLSHSINLFGNTTDLKKPAPGTGPLSFTKLSGLVSVESERVTVNNAFKSLGSTLLRELLVTDSDSPDSKFKFQIYKPGGSDKGSITTNILFETKDTIRLTNSRVEPEQVVKDAGLSYKAGPAQPLDPGYVKQYVEGTSRLAQQFENPIHLMTSVIDKTTTPPITTGTYPDDYNTAPLYGHAYLNGSKDGISDIRLSLINNSLIKEFKPKSVAPYATGPVPLEYTGVVTPNQTFNKPKRFTVNVTSNGATGIVEQTYIEFANLVNRPNNIAGYNITDAVDITTFENTVAAIRQQIADTRKEIRNKNIEDLASIVSDNVIRAHNKYRLVDQTISRLSNLTFDEPNAPDISKTNGYLSIDENISGEFRDLVFKTATSMFNSLNSKINSISATNKTKPFIITRSAERGLINTLILNTALNENYELIISDSELLKINNSAIQLLTELDYVQNELHTVLFLDSMRQRQIDYRFNNRGRGGYA